MSHSTDQPTPDTSVPALLMPDGSRYAGEPLDASRRRSIAIQDHSEQAKRLEADQDHARLDFFYHQGRFWRAIVPLAGIDQVFGQAFNFSRARRTGKSQKILYDRHGLPKRTNPVLNHLQARFTLQGDHAIELFPLDCTDQSAPVHRLHDFIYSLEAVGPPGVSFNLRDALSGNLIGAHRFLSTQEMVFERIVVENQYVTETPPLPLQEQHKRALLEKALLRSHTAGMSEPYYLYRFLRTNNCTSNPFQMLDTVVDYQLAQRLGSLLYRFPISPRLYLRIRGLDSDPSVRKLVRQEFADYVGHPETQQRKREFVRAKTKAIRAARKTRESENA